MYFRWVVAVLVQRFAQSISTHEEVTMLQVNTPDPSLAQVAEINQKMTFPSFPSRSFHPDKIGVTPNIPGVRQEVDNQEVENLKMELAKARAKLQEANMRNELPKLDLCSVMELDKTKMELAEARAKIEKVQEANMKLEKEKKTEESNEEGGRSNEKEGRSNEKANMKLEKEQEAMKKKEEAMKKEQEAMKKEHDADKIERQIEDRKKIRANLCDNFALTVGALKIFAEAGERKNGVWVFEGSQWLRKALMKEHDASVGVGANGCWDAEYKDLGRFKSSFCEAGTQMGMSWAQNLCR